MHYRIAAASILAVSAAAAVTDWQAQGKQWWSHVQFLADDKLEGRNVGSPGFDAAADYVTRQFQSAGLKPGAKSGYSQPVALTKVTLDEPDSRVYLTHGDDIEDERMRFGYDTMITSTANATISEAPLVFVGYGLDIPEAHYSDFNNSDLKNAYLKGAIAVYLAGGPANVSGELRAHYSSANERAAAMKAAGIAGAVAIPNPRSMEIPWARQSANRLQPRMLLADPAIQQNTLSFTATWNPDTADKLFARSGHTMAEILDAANHARPLPHFALRPKMRVHVRVDAQPVQSRNVVGVREGSDASLKNEFVAVSAHLDHLGTGEKVNGDSIFNGAMDDASGIASVVEIARALNTAKVRTQRSLLFLAVTGEEKGLLGSRYFAQYPTVPGNIVADINLDMFLPLFPLRYLEVQGLNESTLGDDIRAEAGKMGIQIQADKEPNNNRFIRSDQYSFIRHGVPALAFKFGWVAGTPQEKIYKDWYRDRYHAVSDDLSQPVDLEAAARFDALLLALIERVADAPQRPWWKPDSFFRRFAR